MRIIDADAFDKALANAQAECKKNGGNFRFGVLSNVRANIADAPTIDAIPVEWLREKMNLADDAGDLDSVDLISWLIQTWQKEQEGR